MGGPTRSREPQTCELLGSLGHSNPSTTLRWSPRRGHRKTNRRTAHKCINVPFPSYPRSTRPLNYLKMVARPSRSGSSSTTCATGSWCGASPLSVPGKWPTSTQTCWARRAAGQRYAVDASVGPGCIEKTSKLSFLVVCFRPCMSTWKLRTSACCPTVRPGPLERTRWSSSGQQMLIFLHLLAQTLVPVLEAWQLSLEQSIYDISASVCVCSYL